MATDLADYMVVNGSTFRQAHDAVGKIVLYAIDNKKELHELKLEEMKQFSKHIKKDVFKWLEPASAIKRRNLLGGTGSRAVRECIIQAKTETNS